MKYDHYKCIRFQREGKILNVSFNRPEALNAVNERLHFELTHLFADLQLDDETKVIVLTGEGKAFSAGGDIKWLQSIKDSFVFKSVLWEGRKIITDLLELEKPIIAKVNGPATGLGATLALFCDTVFASEKAKFADPHVKVGITAGDGGAIIWPALIGVCRAKQYLMTGDMISATDAAGMGLINEVVPAEELDKTVQDFATRLANGPLMAIQTTKQAVNKILKAQVNLVLDASLAFEGHTFNTVDHKEAVSAFIEKRSPEFIGR